MANDNDDDELKVIIEMGPHQDGGISFASGWYVPEKTDPETEEFFKSLVAGLFGIISSHVDDVVSTGEMVRSVSDFDNPPASNEEFEVVFEPDEELQKRIDDGKVIDLTQFRKKPTDRDN